MRVLRITLLRFGNLHCSFSTAMDGTRSWWIEADGGEKSGQG